MIGALIAKSKATSSYDLLNARDIKKFLANWHDDCVWCYPGNVSVSGEFKGKKAVEEVPAVFRSIPKHQTYAQERVHQKPF